MNTFQTPVRRTPQLPARQVEGEGILRIILLALALAMPLASMAYLTPSYNFAKKRLS